MIRICVRRLVFPALALCAAFLLHCVSSDSNPYLDTSKVDVLVMPAGFYERDSISIFQTFSFDATLILPEHVDHLKLHADNNRLWPVEDTLIAVAQRGNQAIQCKISFSDTGWNQITLIAVLAGGSEKKIAERKIYAYSPLGQDDIVATQGSIVQLKTMPLPDPVDYYIWKFDNDNRPVIAEACSTTFDTRNAALFATGKLYVKSGSAESPAVAFSLSLLDVLPPTVVAANDSVSDNGKHVYTGNSDFTLRLRISDVGGAVTSAIINNTTFDRIDTANDLYYKVFRRLDTLSGVLPAVIRVSDERKNGVIDTIWIHYSSAYPVSAGPSITFSIPSQDPYTTRSSQVTVRGKAHDILAYDTLYMILFLNATRLGNVYKVTPFQPDWEWQITLPEGSNKVIAGAFSSPDFLLDTIARSSRTIIYDPDFVDSKMPDIIDVRIGNVILDRPYYTSQAQVTVTATIYDESGIKSALLNGSAMVLQGAGVVYSGSVALAHSASGNTLRIAAQDIAGNTAERTFTVYRNSQPRIVTMPTFSYARVGDVYTGVIEVSDPDGDFLTTALTIRTKRDTMSIAVKNGSFSWTPSAYDTGLVKITIQVSDGIQPVDSTYSIAVLGSSILIPDTARFLTRESDFPDTLRVGSDILNIKLKIDQPNTGNYLYSAKIVAAGKMLLDRTLDSVLIWAPLISDTGLQKIEILVSGGQGFADTLLPVIRVLPPLPPATVSFERAGISQLESVTACTINVRLSRALDTTLYAEVSLDELKSTVDTGDFENFDGDIFFSPGDISKQIIVTIINDTVFENDEHLVLKLWISDENIARPGTHMEFTCIIVNDDEQIIEPKTIVAGFGAYDTTGVEQAETLFIPVILSRDTSDEVKLSISVFGTATQDQDFRLLSKDITIPKGNDQAVVAVEIINDTLCEKIPEYFTLRLAANEGVQVGPDSLFRYTIIDDDSARCKTSIVLVTNSNMNRSIDFRIRDTLSRMGFLVTMRREDQITSNTFSQTDLVVISQSATTDAAGKLLRDKPIPVLCANSDNYIALGYTSSGRMADSITNTVRILGNSFYMQNVRITFQLETFACFRPYGQAKIIGSMASDTTRALIVQYEKNATLVSGLTAPARRAAFCMAQFGSHSEAEYRNAWWLLLKSNVNWSLGK